MVPLSCTTAHTGTFGTDHSEGIVGSTPVQVEVYYTIVYHISGYSS